MSEVHEGASGGGRALEEAEAHLKAAEASLERARAEEVSAEREIEKAADEIAEAAKNDFTIIVNGRSKPVHGKKQSYRNIARVAFSDADFERFLYTITFFNGAHGQEGDLVEGETVRVKDEMVFNVRRSDKS